MKEHAEADVTKGETVVVVVVAAIAVILAVGIISLFTPTPGHHPDLSISMSYGCGEQVIAPCQLEIDGNGNVSYDESHVVRTGNYDFDNDFAYGPVAVGGGHFVHEKRSGKITPQQVEALVAAIRKTNSVLAISTLLVPPPQFAVRNTCDFSGCPSIDLAFTLNGQSRRIQYEGFCGWLESYPPQAVCDLEHQIAGISHLAVWATPTPGPSPTPTPTAPPTATPPPTNTPPAIMRAGDFGILSQEPCGPPCFLGIRPGVTTFDDAVLILKNAGVPCRDVGTGGGLMCDSGDARIAVSASGYCTAAGSGLAVAAIVLWPPVMVTLGEFIAHYGPPDSLLIDPVLWTQATYDSLQTLVYLAHAPGPSYTVAPGTIIDRVVYVTAAEYSMCLHNPANTQQPWRGYGTFTPKAGP